MPNGRRLLFVATLALVGALWVLLGYSAFTTHLRLPTIAPSAAPSARPSAHPTASPVRVPDRVLVVVNGEVRGGSAAWASMLKRLVAPHKADLALIVGRLPNNATLLHRASRHVWEVPEYDDWGIVLDQAASKNCASSNWRKLCADVDAQFLGGVKPCRHPGSAGILLAFRYLFTQKLAELQGYDWFVFTRADFLYLCDHVDVRLLDPTKVWAKLGEEYGGYSDRHIVTHHTLVRKTHGVTEDVVCNPDVYRELVRDKEGWYNLESVLKEYWQRAGLAVSQFPLPAFTVRAEGDSTRWSQGKEHADTAHLGVRIKYPDEYELAKRMCNTTAKELGLQL